MFVRQIIIKYPKRLFNMDQERLLELNLTTSIRNRGLTYGTFKVGYLIDSKIHDD